MISLIPVILPLRCMAGLELTSSAVFDALSGLPGAGAILDAIEEETGLAVAVYGGALRDLAIRGAPGHDLDVIVYGESQKDFRAAMSKVAARSNATIADYPGSHVVLTPRSGGLFFDVHYPKHSFLEGLVRSDLTINAIAFLWKERLIEDPFGGIEDLRARRIRLHSPQYAVTNAPNFPRIFRTAAALGFAIEGDTEKILRRCGPMITLHDDRANLRTLLELLKFFSAETIAPQLAQMHRFRLIESLFPELVIPSSVGMNQQQSVLDRNVALAAAIDSIETSDQIRQFLSADLGRSISNRGFIRLMALFLDLGSSYYLFDKNAPYIRVVAGEDASAFVRHCEKRLLAHIAARYSESKELSIFFSELPGVLAYLSAGPSGKLPESLPQQSQDRAVILRALVQSIQP